MMVAVRSWVCDWVGRMGRFGRAVVVVVLVFVLSGAVAVMGRVWWTHPLKRSAALPPGIEQGRPSSYKVIFRRPLDDRRRVLFVHEICGR